MKGAIESNDYGEWSELMGNKGRIAKVITENNFEIFVEMYEAMEAGNYESAQEIRKDLGLGIKSQDGEGFRKGMHGDSQDGKYSGKGGRGGFNR